jgi:hypothetical protein
LNREEELRAQFQQAVAEVLDIRRKKEEYVRRHTRLVKADAEQIYGQDLANASKKASAILRAWVAMDEKLDGAGEKAGRREGRYEDVG